MERDWLPSRSAGGRVGEQNERKQVPLPRVYNPEMTVCSAARLTPLRAARLRFTSNLLGPSCPPIDSKIL